MTDYHANRLELGHFADEILVVCPQCDGCATTRSVGQVRRLTCSCGYTTDTPPLRPALWLQTPCAGELLWAYNARHLAFLEAFVAAKLRPQVRDTAYGWSNRSMASRLPKWIQAAKHRRAVLRGLARLRERLAR